MITPAVVIMQNAGINHTSKVRYASIGPPILKPIAVIVWVEVGPGRIWQSAFNSINSSSLAPRCGILTKNRIKTITILITESKKKGNRQVNIGPIKDDNACPIPFETELRIANVPNHPDRSSGGIESEIIEYPTGKTQPSPAPESILEMMSI